MNTLKRFLRNEEGLETVEYAIITGLVVAGTIGLIATLGSWVYDQFDRVNTEVGAE
jgi:Flp pilus assembly pilin Flp